MKNALADKLDEHAATGRVIDDIRVERRRQIEKEGWNSDHDDSHDDGSLALAAASYAFRSTLTPTTRAKHVNALDGDGPAGFISLLTYLWPTSWDQRWFKPKNRRRDLVRAGALIVAEIERLDRASR